MVGVGEGDRERERKRVIEIYCFLFSGCRYTVKGSAFVSESDL